MAAFPQYNEIPMDPTIEITHEFKTLVSKFDDEGEENRKQKWLYPKRRIRVRYNFISKAHAETLWEFYLARKGRYGAFNFFVPEPQLTYPSYTGEYVGTGDGSTEVFNLPCKSAVSYTVYIDNSEQTEGINYNFTSGGGTDGADKIAFDDSNMVSPSDGAIITCDFTGALKVRCRFAEDFASFSMFRDRRGSVSFELQGLLNE